jgi:hypothetical protein
MNRHKKTYKICIRKLPARDFSAEDFQVAVDRLNQHLTTLITNSENKLFDIDHFIDGKIR